MLSGRRTKTAATTLFWHDHVSEEPGLELFVPLACFVHEGLKFGFVTNILQQRVAHEIGIAKEPASDAMPEHVKRGRFVA